MTDEVTRPPDEPAFWWQDLDEYNVADLARTLATTIAPHGQEPEHPAIFFGIVSEKDGGIIAYAIGEEHANEIVDALRKNA